jgi:predicted membrane metal-binding protein
MRPAFLNSLLQPSLSMSASLPFSFLPFAAGFWPFVPGLKERLSWPFFQARRLAAFDQTLQTAS